MSTKVLKVRKEDFTSNRREGLPTREVVVE